MQVNIGKGIELAIDATALPANALEHVIRIGLRNVLMDAHASITEKEFPVESERQDAARAVAEKKLAALMAGDVRVAGTRGPRAGDPVSAEINVMARKAIIAACKAQKVDPAQVENFAQLVADYRTANEAALRKAAEIAVAARADVAPVESDVLAGLRLKTA